MERTEISFTDNEQVTFSAMKIFIRSRDKVELGVLELKGDATVKELKQEFAKINTSFSVERQRYSTEEGKALEDNNQTLSSFGLTDGSEVYLKDLGPQIEWRTVFLIEYFGPMLIYTFFFLQPSLLYGEGSSDPATFLQKLAFGCWIFHFAKREFETVFVHRFSNDTMPIMNLWKNCAHYWSAGLLTGYLINTPGYAGPNYFSMFFGFILFVLGEAGNGITHIQLRNLRKPGTRDRNIPKGFLFNFVSCPNYTCEILAWVGFSLMTGSLASWLFTILGAAQMFLWAKRKHIRYRKEFPTYPKNRKVLIPFVV